MLDVTEKEPLSTFDESVSEVLYTLSSLQSLTTEIYDRLNTDWVRNSWLPVLMASPQVKHLKVELANPRLPHIPNETSACHLHQIPSCSLNLFATGPSKLETICLQNITWNAGDIGRIVTENRDTIQSINLADWSCEPTLPSWKAIEVMAAIAGLDLLARVTFEQSPSQLKSFCARTWENYHGSPFPPSLYWKVTAARLYHDDICRNLPRKRKLSGLCFAVPLPSSITKPYWDQPPRGTARLVDCPVN